MMDRDGIPDEVRRFVLDSIPSVPFLEALLQMRSAAASDWDKERLAGKVYVNTETATAILAELLAAGFVAQADEERPRRAVYRYRPASEELRSMVDRLAHAYGRHLVGISELIHRRNGKSA